MRSPVVLVVEDEALLRSVTGEYLRLCGYVVIEASDAAGAIEVTGQKHPEDPFPTACTPVIEHAVEVIQLPVQTSHRRA